MSHFSKLQILGGLVMFGMYFLVDLTTFDLPYFYEGKVYVPIRFFFYSGISSVNWILGERRKMFFLSEKKVFFWSEKNILFFVWKKNFFNFFSDVKKFHFLTKKIFFWSKKNIFRTKTENFFGDPKFNLPKKSHYKEKT